MGACVADGLDVRLGHRLMALIPMGRMRAVLEPDIGGTGIGKTGVGGEHGLVLVGESGLVFGDGGGCGFWIFEKYPGINSCECTGRDELLGLAQTCSCMAKLS